jgi:CDP-glycerol glycerophosphotransferase
VSRLFGARRVDRSDPLVSVVVPAYRVEEWLSECLESLVDQEYPHWEALVIDDGSPDRTGELADTWAVHEPRIRVVHTPNRGLGAARNEGIRHSRGTYLAFLDSDDVLPPVALSSMVASLETSGSDFAAGSLVRWEDGRHDEPRWMRRLHRQPLTRARIEELPELLGDVFATDKLFRRSFWDRAGLAFPEGLRYEDQPMTTRAFLAGTFDVLPDIVYHWRIRSDGTSISQQRAAVADLRDRWVTKRMSMDAVRAHGDDHVTRMFIDRVLAGDLWRYFAHLPEADDEWWLLLREGVLEFWGERSLVHTGLSPVHRLTGWLIEQDRRTDAAAVIAYARELGRRADRVHDDLGARIDVPVLDPAFVDRAALALRDHEH